MEGQNGGYLDNTKHFIVWLCNMKQLNFRHFNTNSEKFFVTGIFFQKEAKSAPKRPILFRSVYQGVLGHFATIDHLHDDVVLLLRPESFRVLLSCAN